MAWIESPSNPGLDVADIRAIADAVHASGGRLAVDNTLCTPLGQRPLDLGADAAMVSATKALSGHSDIVLGAVATRDPEWVALLRKHRSQGGSIAGPFEAWMLHRSLPTLALRLARQSANAAQMAGWLRRHPDVRDVRHPSGQAASAQMAFTGPLVCFTLEGEERAQRFLDALELVAEATSFGGVHSTAERRGRWGTDAVEPGFIRFSCGCEDVEDLLADVEQALASSARADAVAVEPRRFTNVNTGWVGGRVERRRPTSGRRFHLHGGKRAPGRVLPAQREESARSPDRRLPARLPTQPGLTFGHRHDRGAKPSAARPTFNEPMPRPTTVFTCAACGHEEPKWHGRCAGCGEWNTLAEEKRAPAAPARGGGGRAASAGRAVAPVRLADVQAVRIARLQTGIGELDRVLGGGLVPGSLVLLGGSPGIGKSTLTSMALGNLQGAGRRTLYVSGEESAAQIKLRAERLPGAALEVPVLAETDLDTVLATLDAERPEVCVIDSVQTLHAADLTGAAGSVGQVREVADRITRLAKARDIAVLLVGHVTKEGALAGPRVLEHLVDAVLQFEGERERTYRTLRALKNRFGSVSEAGVFEMRQSGLVEVQDASARFVGEATRAPGSVVLAAMEGSRPLLVEVQALVSPSELVPPRRIANGIDRNRLALVLAVLGPPRRRRGRERRRVRQRRGRRPRRRAGRRPRGRAGRRERGQGHRRRRRRAARRLLRRDRPHRGAAHGRAPRAAPRRGEPSSACAPWSRRTARGRRARARPRRSARRSAPRSAQAPRAPPPRSTPPALRNPRFWL